MGKQPKPSHNRLRRLTKSRLDEAKTNDQVAFNRWHAQIKNSKHSQQQDLPSSQLPAKMSLILTNTAQLFVVIDTCTLCTHRIDFMDYVTQLRQIFPFRLCPIRFIISLPVLEELDKCNRRQKKPQQLPKKQDDHISGTNSTGDGNNNLEDVISAVRITTEPPRSFMRFVEEEMRASEIIISDMDPFKRTKLGEIGQNLEIINSDDRILECCLRSQAFVDTQQPHPDTKVILVTEDNVFKSKATTFGIVSYRWTEFKHKFKNFGLKHYVSTPKPDLPKAVRRSLAIRMKPGSRRKPKQSISDDEDSDDDVEIIGEVITVN